MGRVIKKLVTSPKPNDGSTGLECAGLLALAVVIYLVAMTSPGPNANPVLPRDAALAASAVSAD